MIRVEGVRVEGIGTLIAKPPLAVGKRVDCEVKEGVGLEFGVLDLALRGEGAVRWGRANATYRECHETTCL